MIKLALFFIMAHLIQESQQQDYLGYPSEFFDFSNKEWGHNMNRNNLRKMTEEIYRDALVKAEHAKQLQETYKDDVTYEIGVTAANIESTFAHMLEVYRLYANVSAVINETHTAHDFINGYQVIQGDYNQIRVEQEKFKRLSDDYEKNKDQIERMKAVKALKQSMADDLKRGDGRRQFYRGKAQRRTTTRKRLWEHKVKWFSENDRLKEFY